MLRAPLAALVAVALQAPAAARPTPAEPPRSSAPAAADPLRGEWSRPSGKRVTIAATLTVEAALERIADTAGWSLVVDAGDAGRKELALRLREVPAEDAFRAVLSQAGLVAERKGDLITVRSEGLLPGILPSAIGQRAQRATEDALQAAQRAIRRSALDRGEDQGEDQGDADRDRHAGGGVVVGAGEAVRDAVTWGGDVRLDPGARARNVVALGGSVHLEPNTSTHDAVALGGRTVVGAGARVEHDAVALGGDVVLGPGAEVQHDAVSIGGKVQVDPAARVLGSVQSISLAGLSSVPAALHGRLAPRPHGPFPLLLEALVTFAILFVLGLGVVALFPQRLEAVSAALSGGPLRSLFAGLFGSMGMALLALVLLLTVVGIVLLPVWFLLVLAGGVMGTVAFVSYAGRLLPFPRSRRTVILELAAGTLLFSILVHVPHVGWMVWVATWLLGFGAVLRTRFGGPSGAPVLPTAPAP